MIYLYSDLQKEMKRCVQEAAVKKEKQLKEREKEVAEMCKACNSGTASEELEMKIRTLEYYKKRANEATTTHRDLVHGHKKQRVELIID